MYYSAAQGIQDTVTGFLLLHDISPVDYAIPRVAITYLSPTYHLFITILGQSEAFLRRLFSISFFQWNIPEKYLLMFFVEMILWKDPVVSCERRGAGTPSPAWPPPSAGRGVTGSRRGKILRTEGLDITTAESGLIWVNWSHHVTISLCYHVTMSPCHHALSFVANIIMFDCMTASREVIAAPFQPQPVTQCWLYQCTDWVGVQFQNWHWKVYRLWLYCILYTRPWQVNIIFTSLSGLVGVSLFSYLLQVDELSDQAHQELEPCFPP